MNRRQLLITAAGLTIGSAGLAAPALAQARTRLRVGHLHVVAVDAQIWTGMDRGSFEKQGLDLELKEYSTGVELFQALASGDIDVLSAGGVISNFPARGSGRVFLINDIEIATAQLWVRPDLGVRTFADLKGKRIATTAGTTAHLFLDRALRANNIDPSDVTLVDQPMPAAVASLVAGVVPAVALWVPFNITVRDKVPSAIKLVDASAFYPQAAVIGGWAARNDQYADKKEILSKVIRGWTEANDYMVRYPAAAMEALWKNHYGRATPADISEAFKAQKIFSSREWKRLYSDGTVVKWLQQGTDFFVTDVGAGKAIPASEYFDPGLYLSVMS